MFEGLILNGGQKEVLRKAIINSYQNFDELRMLLSDRMNESVEAIARGDTNESRVFNLIEKFQGDGRIGEFIQVIVENRPNSPFFVDVKKEFPSIFLEVETLASQSVTNGKQILYVDYRGTNGTFTQLTYSLDNPNPDNSVSIRRSLTRLEQEIEDSDNRSRTSQILYQWLNGSEKILEVQEETILALAFPETLAHYPWESLYLINNNLIPLRWAKRSVAFAEPKDRPLSVLFMAAQPNGVETKLDCEEQETKILERTKRYPLNLLVEESGWLDELQAICYHHQHDFDILHLTGVVNSHEGKACLLTEDEFGECCYSSAEDIATAIGKPFPKLILLCAEAEYSWVQNEITTLTRDLISQGAEAVLTFRYDGAEVLIATLYNELARGETLNNALKLIYRESCRQARGASPLLPGSLQSSFILHLADTELLSRALVTRGQKPHAHFSNETTFRDEAGNMKVSDRYNFVGRRRQLQNCLKALKIDTDKVGVILHGMGGLGKSTIASRLICDRLPVYENLIWSQWGQKKQKRETLDTDKLLAGLAKHLYREKDLGEYLRGTNIQTDLSNLFEELSKRGRLLVLIFDDFEWNLEPLGGSYKILEEAANVLKSLVDAIIFSQTRHKIILTCRYDNFDDGEILNLFYSQGLDGLSGADLQKKLRRLEHFNSDQIPSEVVEKAIALGNGNPRLLEDLNEKVLSLPPTEAEKLLTDYENNPEQWKGRVIWPNLYGQIDEPLAKVLSYGLIYQIPVPRRVLQVVCEDRDGQQIQRGINLGLIEESDQRESSARLYRVSPILPHVLNSIKLPDDEQTIRSFSRRAYQQIDHLWGNKENENQERWAEIFRLAFADKENPDRFREQFTKMISVQHNGGADLAYENELRKEKEYLMANQEQIYQKLEEYLKQQDWKKADYETAFIMYQWMVIENYEDFLDLFREVSLAVIDEIDRLWRNYSEGKFGIKGQAKIYRDLGGTEEWNSDIMNRFARRVGWLKGIRRLERKKVAYHATTQPENHFPVLMYFRWDSTVGWGPALSLPECTQGFWVFPRVKT